MDALLRYVQPLLFGLFDLVVGRLGSDGHDPSTTKGAADERW